MSWKSPRCGQACWDEIKRHDDEREKLVMALVNMTRDRDEWREQHEKFACDVSRRHTCTDVEQLRW